MKKEEKIARARRNYEFVNKMQVGSASMESINEAPGGVELWAHLEDDSLVQLVGDTKIDDKAFEQVSEGSK